MRYLIAEMVKSVVLAVNANPLKPELGPETKTNLVALSATKVNGLVKGSVVIAETDLLSGKKVETEVAFRQHDATILESKNGKPVFTSKRINSGELVTCYHIGTNPDKMTHAINIYPSGAAKIVEWASQPASPVAHAEETL